MTRSALVCVLGSEIKEKFFPNTDPIGKTLKVRGLPMRVVGVEETRGSFFGDSLDRHVYIPATTHMQIFGRNNLQIHGEVSTTAKHFRRAIENARMQMRNKHRLKGNEEDDFGLVDVEGAQQPNRSIHRQHRRSGDAHHGDHSDRGRHRRDEHHAGKRDGTNF